MHTRLVERTRRPGTLRIQLTRHKVEEIVSANSNRDRIWEWALARRKVKFRTSQIAARCATRERSISISKVENPSFVINNEDEDSLRVKESRSMRKKDL